MGRDLQGPTTFDHGWSPPSPPVRYLSCPPSFAIGDVTWRVWATTPNGGQSRQSMGRAEVEGTTEVIGYVILLVLLSILFQFFGKVANPILYMGAVGAFPAH